MQYVNVLYVEMLTWSEIIFPRKDVCLRKKEKEGETVNNTHVLLLLCASELETHPRFLDFLSEDSPEGVDLDKSEGLCCNQDTLLLVPDLSFHL